jgi:Penicillin binding protein transpeptidase domain
VHGAPSNSGLNRQNGGSPRRPSAGWVVLALISVAVVFAAGAFAVTGWPRLQGSAGPASAAAGQRGATGLDSTANPQQAVAGPPSAARPQSTAGFQPGAGQSPSQDAGQLTTAFLQAWSGGALSAAAGLTDNPAAAQAALTAYAQDLHLRKLAGTVASSTDDPGAPGSAGAREAVTFGLSATVAASALPSAASGTWSYHSALTAYQVPDGAGWLIEWDPSLIAPNLTSGQHLAAVVVPPQGTSVTDSGGNLLSSYDDPALAHIASLLAPHAATSAGTPGLSVQIEDLAGQAVPGSQAAVTPPAASRVATTISQQAERAAQQAVAGANGSAIVVLQPSTGYIRAIANNAQFNDFALTAKVAPGSTMKIITATALINSGLTSESSPVSCPAAYTVQGITYHNDKDESEPAGTPFSADFAQSCNNAFAQWWGQLNGQLASAAQAYYGLNQAWDIGLPGQTATYFSAPPGASGSELAEEAFGEGQLTASPLAMASVAATVESGQFRQPVLVPGTPTVSASPLPASTDEQLRDMMRDVVTEGTAAGIGLGPDVYAKTGTADVQDQDQPNSWMVAFDPGQDIAVAALVINAGYGAQVAGLEVKTFFGAY